MKRLSVFAFLIFAVIVLSPNNSEASKNAHNKYQQKQYKHASTSVQPKKYASLIVDAETGQVLHQENADVQRYPASLTKLMTLYLTFDALQNKQISMNEMVRVSRKAASQQRINLSLKEGDKISIKNLVSSVAVVSANDSAVVLAERIGGTEANFAKMMTAKAREIGMKNSRFMNASGLFNQNQVTTAKDMAVLMHALKKDFPEYYDMLSVKQFVYKGKPYKPHTAVAKNFKWTKAAKTGYVRQSGFNVVVGAEKNNSEIVGVVMGGTTAKARDKLMVSLLEKGFTKASKRTNYAYNAPQN
jgi:D-alanyl-D-alanine carboxypeptidase